MTWRTRFFSHLLKAQVFWAFPKSKRPPGSHVPVASSGCLSEVATAYGASRDSLSLGPSSFKNSLYFCEKTSARSGYGIHRNKRSSAQNYAERICIASDRYHCERDLHGNCRRPYDERATVLCPCAHSIQRHHEVAVGQFGG